MCTSVWHARFGKSVHVLLDMYDNESTLYVSKYRALVLVSGTNIAVLLCC